MEFKGHECSKLTFCCANTWRSTKQIIEGRKVEAHDIISDEPEWELKVFLQSHFSVEI